VRIYDSNVSEFDLAHRFAVAFEDALRHFLEFILQVGEIALIPKPSQRFN
jgi:hypothetical protein